MRYGPSGWGRVLAGCGPEAVEAGRAMLDGFDRPQLVRAAPALPEAMVAAILDDAELVECEALATRGDLDEEVAVRLARRRRRGVMRNLAAFSTLGERLARALLEGDDPHTNSAMFLRPGCPLWVRRHILTQGPGSPRRSGVVELEYSLKKALLDDPQWAGLLVDADDAALVDQAARRPELLDTDEQVRLLRRLLGRGGHGPALVSSLVATPGMAAELVHLVAGAELSGAEAIAALDAALDARLGPGPVAEVVEAVAAPEPGVAWSAHQSEALVAELAGASASRAPRLAVVAAHLPWAEITAAHRRAPFGKVALGVLLGWPDADRELLALALGEDLAWGGTCTALDRHHLRQVLGAVELDDSNSGSRRLGELAGLAAGAGTTAGDLADSVRPALSVALLVERAATTEWGAATAAGLGELLVAGLGDHGGAWEVFVGLAPGFEGTLSELVAAASLCAAPGGSARR